MSWISDTQPLTQRETLNGDILPLTNNLMLRVLGNPRGNYDQSCQSVTHPVIRKLIVTESVGPFKVTGLKPAVDQLRSALTDLRTEMPEIYAVLGSAGMLCVRYVRGSKSSISNHSWGCAIDFTLEGKLDTRGDNRAQKGLTAMHPIMNRHNFFWGAAFKTEDSMHFEISRQQLLAWHRDGAFGEPQELPQEAHRFSIGDRGPEVEWTQQRLNILSGFDVDEDGIFGPATRAAVIEFQRQHGLTADGVLGPKTMEALKNAPTQ
ncbi:D-alanyl-D-alanine carboxypeptidase-like protein [Rhizobium sp. AG855]|nr:D-alanyl-D-alanine carboxypeptidase-like protein [Rhizobium sp. AG855]